MINWQILNLRLLVEELNAFFLQEHLAFISDCLILILSYFLPIHHSLP